MNDFKKLYENIGYNFQSRSLLVEALTHSSKAEGRQGEKNNERLEFLGDRVLGLVLADYFYKTYEKEKEGIIARRFSSVVCTKTLADIARKINLGDYLLMGNSEITEGGKNKNKILEDATEALIGAIYLDAGFEKARKIILNLWQEKLNKQDLENLKDAKSKLQEYSQANSMGLPIYETVKKSGLEHEPNFVVRVSVENDFCEASGKSKKKAQLKAAKKLLDKIKGKNDE